MLQVPAPQDPSPKNTTSLPQRRERVQRVLGHIQDSQNDARQKQVISSYAAGLLSEPSIGETLLAAVESNFARKESVISPLAALRELQEALVDLSRVTAEQLIALGRIYTDPVFKGDEHFANQLRSHLSSLTRGGASGGTLSLFGVLSKAVKAHISGAGNFRVLADIQELSQELSRLNPSLEEAKWFIEQAERLAKNPTTQEVLKDLDLLFDSFAIALDREDLRARERYSRFFRRELVETGYDISLATRNMHALAPLLERSDISPETLKNFNNLLKPIRFTEEDIIPDEELTIDKSGEVAAFIRIITEDSPPPEAIDLSLSMIQEVLGKTSKVLENGVLLSLARLAVYLRDLAGPDQEEVRKTAEELYVTFGAESSRLGIVVYLLQLASAQKDRADLVSLIGQSLKLHQKDPDEAFAKIDSSLKALLHPSAPPDLVRTYLEAMKDERFSNSRASASLLRRLGMHAALYVLPEADDTMTIAQGLAPITDHLKKHPHMFLQEEPDAAKYRALQEAFYPAVRGAYEQDRRTGRDRAQHSRRPFHLLIPPLQRSLGGFIRVSDVHHGFGIHAIPSRRTPDGEAPLMVRFGLGHGKVSMLNTNDNRQFPGKGFALSSIEPQLLFPARPAGAEPGTDPFALYKRAWPSLGKNIERLAHAQFIFSRGMIVITGIDPNHYTIRRADKRLQYSLVIFNAHFENPFNEVAILAPTVLLRDFFKGTFSSLDDYRGFNPNKVNARAIMPNPRIFHRHRELGRYVINVGLPETIMLGVTDSLSNEHHAWLNYREDALQYERELRNVDRGFARQTLKNFERHPDSAHLRPTLEPARKLINHEDLIGLPPLSSTETHSLHAEEYRLIRERSKLIERFEALDKAIDPLERETWQCVNRLMDLYDLLRVGFAYYTRGMTTPRSLLPQEEIEVELGDAEAAGFNAGGELMLQELYRSHSQHEQGTVDRNRFPVLVTGEALYSSRYGEAAVLIDSYDMRGVVKGRPVQFTPGEMTLDDVGVWQANILAQVQDTAGSIPEFRLVERSMLPRPLLAKLESVHK